jgi:hypothetical protein
LVENRKSIFNWKISRLLLRNKIHTWYSIGKAYEYSTRLHITILSYVYAQIRFERLGFGDEIQNGKGFSFLEKIQSMKFEFFFFYFTFQVLYQSIVYNLFWQNYNQDYAPKEEVYRIHMIHDTIYLIKSNFNFSKRKINFLLPTILQ